MLSSKPLASLSSGLLARKGHARPAMRPQSLAFGSGGQTLEDLGWNDMGTDLGEAPAPTAVPPAPILPVSTEPPLVLRQRARLRKELAVAPEPEAPDQDAPERAVAETVHEIAAQGVPKAKAAFTLRLDPARHLRLRLASALSGRSAQRLVTEALDQFLSQSPEVAVMAQQIEEQRIEGRQADDQGEDE
ncbi:MAG: hypothetical protein K2X76_13515 [Sphingomonas sp.]|nr:hypothetical protein [Sphingomonas sp.]